MTARQVDCVYVKVAAEILQCRGSIFTSCYVVRGPLIDLCTLYFSNIIVCFMVLNIQDEMKWEHFKIKWMHLQQVECV